MVRHNKFRIIIFILATLFITGSAQAQSGHVWGENARDDYDPEMVVAVQRAVNAYMPNDSMYAISDISSTPDPYAYLATVVVMPLETDPENWNFNRHVTSYFWVHLIQAPWGYVGAVQGTPEYDNQVLLTENLNQDHIDLLLEPRLNQIEEPQSFSRSVMEFLSLETTSNSRNDSGPISPNDPVFAHPIFPWYPGKVVRYGVLGVHDFGYDANLPGWKAVDFVSSPIISGTLSAPNMWYASQGGIIAMLCNDGTQTAFVINSVNFAYVHLVPNYKLKTFYAVKQGEELGPAVQGSSNTNCGYTDQTIETYHLHIGFPANSNPVWEEFRLIEYTETFENSAGVVISPTMFITSTWETSPVEIPPNPENIGFHEGTNFWDYFTSGVLGYFGRAATIFPDRQGSLINLARIAAVVDISLRLIYTVAVLNFEIPMTILATVLVLEGIRLVYVLYRSIRKLTI
jgi:hypothetical protein